MKIFDGTLYARHKGNLYARHKGNLKTERYRHDTKGTSRQHFAPAPNAFHKPCMRTDTFKPTKTSGFRCGPKGIRNIRKLLAEEPNETVFPQPKCCKNMVATPKRTRGINQCFRKCQRTPKRVSGSLSEGPHRDPETTNLASIYFHIPLYAYQSSPTSEKTPRGTPFRSLRMAPSKAKVSISLQTSSKN